MGHKILAINPGSTSTKIAVYDDENLMFSETINHSAEELSKFSNIVSQFGMRKEAIVKLLEKNNFDIKTLSTVVGRGGLLPPVKSGAYLVNDIMIDRLENRPVLEHASNLGALISYEIAKSLNIKAYIYDSVAVDELSDVARVLGFEEIERTCLSHALNSRAMAIKFAKDNSKNYSDMNLIVAHLGGGITIAAHEKGKMVDVVSDDEGPFSPERSGRIPVKKVVDMCYSGKYTQREMLKKIRGKGGIVAHLGTVDVREVEAMIDNNNEKAKLIHEAMAYQVAKGIGEMATVLEGNVDAVILTGGIAYSKKLTDSIKNKVKFIAPVEVLAGENELESLAYGALRILKNEELAKEYKENEELAKA
ncbi:MAG: butyrate kinase [Paraclostridium sp.]